MRRPLPLVHALVLLPLVASAQAQKPAQYPVDQNAVIAAARRLASTAYVARGGNLPAGLENLRADQYKDIRFLDTAAIWADQPVPFRLGLLPAGFYFQSPVTIALVDQGVSQELQSSPGMFEIGPSAPQNLARVPLPLSGFSIRTRIDSPKTWDEFLRFQGASYFRARARGQIFGLAARGLTVNIAEPMGEEFPAFTQFWIHKPAAKAQSMVIDALLDSPSVTGAYHFTVQPGVETVMDVDAMLFARAPIRVLGVAPLTSMFLYDESNRMRRDDYRAEVHNSDGLQIMAASGESIWRPLANPAKLQISSFTTEPPKGFGLMQRSRSPEDFQDLDSQYDRRPSAWIEPTSDWGAGAVELVEIPAARETNDNITAFWRPAGTLTPGRPWRFAYRITWMGQSKPQKGLARVVSTRSGVSPDGGRRVFMIDYTGIGDKTTNLRLDIGASAGKIGNLSITPYAAIKGFRVGFDLTPRDAEVIELRLRVLQNDKPVTETWLYRWTAT
ncbi:MAG: glucan biosynthesis protein G [Steroidobacteraceae bacterium]